MERGRSFISVRGPRALLVALVVSAMILGVPLAASGVEPPVITYGIVDDANTSELIAGADITLWKWNSATGNYAYAYAMTTGTDGAFSFADSNGLGAGDYRVEADADGYEWNYRSFAWDGSTPYVDDLTLEAYPSIAAGIATDALSDATVAGAYVEAYRDEGEGYVLFAGDTYTAADGSFTVRDEQQLGAGDYKIAITAKGYYDEFITGDWDGTNPLAAGFELDAKPVLASGTIKDSGTGTPLGDGFVDVDFFDPVAGEFVYAGSVGAEDDGTFVVYDRGLGAGEYWFEAGCDGYESLTGVHIWDGLAPMEFDIELSPPPAVVPIAGEDRFETAVMASTEAYPNGLLPDGERTVVIATGRNWPDALGGTSLAGVLDGPILLVEPTSIPSVVEDEIERLGADKAIILGGTTAVSTGVESQLKGLLGDGDVDRIGGQNRYETAEQVAARVRGLQGTGYDGYALVATGGNFPDALAAAPIAAGRWWPLYLANPITGLSDTTKAAMAGVMDAVILGGKTVVSQATEDYLLSELGGTDHVTRLAGANRYETAAKVAAFGVDEAWLRWDRVAIATGANFPDALAGGVLQAKKNSVMLLTPSTALDGYAQDVLIAQAEWIDTVTFFGGTNAVSQAVRDAVLAAVE